MEQSSDGIGKTSTLILRRQTPTMYGQLSDRQGYLDVE